ncbi:MAG TPA: ABC transporter permease [Acidimicrobiales bacterium]|nr:ABC transporter permease [Acidimicrobiales bacterium]
MTLLVPTVPAPEAVVAARPGRRDVATGIGVACGAAFLAMAVLGMVHPGNPNALVAAGPEPPSLHHLFGTDGLGRDVFWRTAAGAWTSLWVSLVAVGSALAVALPLGLLAGSAGGRVDGVVMRALEVPQALPQFVLVIVLLSLFGSGAVQMALCLGVAFVPFFARIARAATAQELHEDYVEGLAALGVGRYRVLFGDVAVNVVPAVAVQAFAALAVAIFAEGGLSFLGLGVPPPAPTLGGLVAEAGTDLLAGLWWYAVLPGVVLLAGILGANLVGDHLDDRLAGRRPARRQGRWSTRGPGRWSTRWPGRWSTRGSPR